MLLVASAKGYLDTTNVPLDTYVEIGMLLYGAVGTLLPDNLRLRIPKFKIVMEEEQNGTK